MGGFIFDILNGILSFMLFSMFAYVIMSWLISFNVVNTRNAAVYQIWRVLELVVNPILEPFRRILPNLGGLDLSPLIAALIIGAVQRNFLGLDDRMAFIQLLGG